MTETLTFPGLGLTIELDRVAFWIGNLPIYWYGIIFATGFLLGLLYFHLRARKVGIHPYEGLDVLLWSIIGGVIGARAYFVIFQWEALYKANPIKIFAFREGGLAIYGGVIGALIVGFIACRIKKIPFLPMLDVGLPALLLAQAIGRWGNFFNIEAFGVNTELPWGMTSKTIEQYLSRPDVVDSLAVLGQTANPYLPVHPTFFYEFAWNLLGFVLLAWVLTPRRRFDGQVALGYAAWYGLGRAFIEGLRTDSLVAATPWGVIRVSQWLAIVGVVFAVVLLVYLHVKSRSASRPAWLGIFANSEASAELMARGDAAESSSRRKKKADETDSTVVDQPATIAAVEADSDGVSEHLTDSGHEPTEQVETTENDEQGGADDGTDN